MLVPLYDQNPHHRFPWVTVSIIVLNVVILGSEGVAPSMETVYRFGFVPKRITNVGSDKPLVVRVQEFDPRQGRVVPGPIKELSEKPAEVYLTFITAMFLHGGWLHLVMNMWMLWIFGNNIEDRLGRLMYLMFYLLGGMIGSIAQWAVDPQSTMPMIGASGAVAAVLGGYAITFPKAVVKTLLFFGLILLLDLPALLVLGLWFVLQMFAGLGILPAIMGAEHVAFWAHIGGFVAGVILMPVLSLGASPDGADWKREAQDMFRFEDSRTRKVD
jgi:membrane associated rhomboid family serine protease